MFRYDLSVYDSCAQMKVDRVDNLLHRISASIVYRTAYDFSDNNARNNIASVECFSNLFVQEILSVIFS